MRISVPNFRYHLWYRWDQYGAINPPLWYRVRKYAVRGLVVASAGLVLLFLAWQALKITWWVLRQTWGVLFGYDTFDEGLIYALYTGLISPTAIWVYHHWAVTVPVLLVLGVGSALKRATRAVNEAANNIESLRRELLFAQESESATKLKYQQERRASILANRDVVKYWLRVRCQWIINYSSELGAVADSAANSRTVTAGRALRFATQVLEASANLDRFDFNDNAFLELVEVAEAHLANAVEILNLRYASRPRYENILLDYERLPGTSVPRLASPVRES